MTVGEIGSVRAGEHWHVRRGLGRLAARARAGEPITAAVIGGSITWSGGDAGLVAAARRSLQQRFPAIEIYPINAGIGGTASDFGAFRLAHDTLHHDPDVLFVEFAVNDAECDENAIVASMEGIVRHAQRSLPDCELCLLYTLAQRHLPDYAAGRLPREVEIHERVAAHYDLPSVNLGAPIAQAIGAGEMTWADFANDTCHPHAAGYSLYERTLDAAIGAMLEAPVAEPSPAPSSLSRLPIEAGRLTLPRPTVENGAWRVEPRDYKGGWDCFEALLVCETPAAIVTFDFDGQVVGVCFNVGPSSGDLNWAIDDSAWRTLRVFDDHAVRFSRPQYRILADDLAPGPHRLRICVAETSDPRSDGRRVELGYLMIQ